MIVEDTIQGARVRSFSLLLPLANERKEPMRRIRLYRLDERMLGLLIREEATTRCMCGAPADAACVGVNYDHATRAIIVAFEHPSFAPVELGEEAPRARVAFEIVDHPQRDLGMHIPTEIGTGPMYTDDYAKG